MNKNIKTINHTKTLYKMISVILLIVALVMSTSVVAFADGTTDDNSVTDSLTSLSDFIVAIVKIVGFIIALYGVVQIALSFVQHDGSQRVQHVMFFAVGVIIFFAKEILDIIGITLN